MTVELSKLSVFDRTGMGTGTTSKSVKDFEEGRMEVYGDGHPVDLPEKSIEQVREEFGLNPEGKPI